MDKQIGKAELARLAVFQRRYLRLRVLIFHGLCITHKNQFLESLGVDDIEADHAITMTQIPHCFGITPLKTALNCVNRI